jgi:hypothetical protein
MRLDSDAVFNKPVAYDPFAELVGGGFLTAYSMLGMPDIWPDESSRRRATRLLVPIIGELLHRGVMPPPDLTVTGNHGLGDTLWSGPLQLSSLSLYRSAEFLRFMESIDVWTVTAAHVREQAIHTFWLKLAVPRAKALWLCDLDMWHKITFGARCTRIKC